MTCTRKHAYSRSELIINGCILVTGAKYPSDVGQSLPLIDKNLS